jgi:ABC-type antimicrobial peptide transport system permease subunit
VLLGIAIAVAASLAGAFFPARAAAALDPARALSES